MTGQLRSFLPPRLNSQPPPQPSRIYALPLRRAGEGIDTQVVWDGHSRRHGRDRLIVVDDVVRPRRTRSCAAPPVGWPAWSRSAAVHHPPARTGCIRASVILMCRQTHTQSILIGLPPRARRGRSSAPPARGRVLPRRPAVPPTEGRRAALPVLLAGAASQAHIDALLGAALPGRATIRSLSHAVLGERESQCNLWSAGRETGAMALTRADLAWLLVTCVLLHRLFAIQRAQQVQLKTGPAQQEGMRRAGAQAASLLAYLDAHVVPGISTAELDELAHRYTTHELGATAAPLHYGGLIGGPLYDMGIPPPAALTAACGWLHSAMHAVGVQGLSICGFPASTCISVNDCVCHGVPGHRRLRR